MYKEAYEIMNDFIPSITSEFDLKAATLAFYGQHTNSQSIINEAIELYQAISDSPAD